MAGGWGTAAAGAGAGWPARQGAWGVFRLRSCLLRRAGTTGVHEPQARGPVDRHRTAAARLHTPGALARQLAPPATWAPPARVLALLAMGSPSQAAAKTSMGCGLLGLRSALHSIAARGSAVCCAWAAAQAARGRPGGGRLQVWSGAEPWSRCGRPACSDSTAGLLRTSSDGRHARCASLKYSQGPPPPHGVASACVALTARVRAACLASR